jgi:hypothetical protein
MKNRILIETVFDGVNEHENYSMIDKVSFLNGVDYFGLN